MSLKPGPVQTRAPPRCSPFANAPAAAHTSSSTTATATGALPRACSCTALVSMSICGHGPAEPIGHPHLAGVHDQRRWAVGDGDALHLLGRPGHAADRPAELIGHPDVGRGDGERGRARVDLDVRMSLPAGKGVDPRQGPGTSIGDPQGRSVEGQRVGAVSHLDRRVRFLRAGIDALDGVVAAVGDPDAVRAHNDRRRVDPHRILATTVPLGMLTRVSTPFSNPATHKSSPLDATACGEPPTWGTVRSTVRLLGSILATASSLSSAAHTAPPALSQRRRRARQRNRVATQACRIDGSHAVPRQGGDAPATQEDYRGDQGQPGDQDDRDDRGHRAPTETGNGPASPRTRGHRLRRGGASCGLGLSTGLGPGHHRGRRREEEGGVLTQDSLLHRLHLDGRLDAELLVEGVP